MRVSHFPSYLRIWPRFSPNQPNSPLTRLSLQGSLGRWTRAVTSIGNPIADVDFAAADVLQPRDHAKRGRLIERPVTEACVGTNCDRHNLKKQQKQCSWRDQEHHEALLFAKYGTSPCGHLISSRWVVCAGVCSAPLVDFSFMSFRPMPLGGTVRFQPARPASPPPTHSRCRSARPTNQEQSRAICGVPKKSRELGFPFMADSHLGQIAHHTVEAASNDVRASNHVLAPRKRASRPAQDRLTANAPGRQDH